MKKKAKPPRKRRKRTIKAVRGEVLDERNFIDWNQVNVTFNDDGKPIFRNGRKTK